MDVESLLLSPLQQVSVCLFAAKFVSFSWRLGSHSPFPFRTSPSLLLSLTVFESSRTITADYNPTGNTHPADTQPTNASDTGSNQTPAALETDPTPRQDTPVVFPRPAPSFHVDVTTTSVEVSLEASGASTVVQGQLTVREARCVRCRKVETSSYTSSSQAGYISAGPPGIVGVEMGAISGTRETTWDVPHPAPEDAVAYVVIGIISPVDRQPVERIMFLRDADLDSFIWKMRLETIRLRGLKYFLSLKSVKAFRLYRCMTSTGAHRQLELDSSALADLRQLRAAYKLLPWPPRNVSRGWAEWVFDCLDGGSMDVLTKDAFSLEIVLGWSPSRISIALLSPVILSLVIGAWFNSRDWDDLATIQTAWGVASYIATAGGCEYLVRSENNISN